MELNIGKCSIVSYHRKKNPFLGTYTVDGQVLARHAVVRDLGVTFEHNLKFTSHIELTRTKAMQMLGFVLRNSRDFSNVATLKTLYFAYVRSVLEYASVVWSPHYKYQIKSLEAIQHKFLRTIAFKTNYRITDHNYKDIEKTHNIPCLEARRQIYDLVFLHKIINNKIFEPDLLGSIQLKVNSIQTRNNATFSLKKNKTNSSENFSMVRCQKLWNLAGDEGVDVFFDNINKIFNLVSSDKIPFEI